MVPAPYEKRLIQKAPSFQEARFRLPDTLGILYFIIAYTAVFFKDRTHHLVSGQFNGDKIKSLDVE